MITKKVVNGKEIRVVTGIPGFDELVEGGFPNKVYHNLKSTNLIASMFKNYWPFTQVWSDLRITDPNSIQISATPDHYRINLWSFDSKDQYDKKKTFLIGDGVNKSYLIQHNLDSKDLFVSLFQTHQPLVENFVDFVFQQQH